MQFQPGNQMAKKADHRKRSLGSKFVASVLRKWKQHGDACLDRMIVEKPDKFVELVARLVPPIQVDQHVKHDHTLTWVQAIQSIPIDDAGQPVLPRPTSKEIIAERTSQALLDDRIREEGEIYELVSEEDKMKRRIKAEKKRHDWQAAQNTQDACDLANAMAQGNML